MTEYLNIGWEDVEPILREHTGNRVFADSLERAVASDDLVSVLSRYIYFNSVFGSGVANLAGEIASRQDLFRDADEAIDIAADRSVEVAAQIFFAAIDEFGGNSSIRRCTHRSLAQATLKATGCFFRLTPVQLNGVTRLSDSTKLAIREVCDGYCINQTVDDPKLFRGIGFHIGSEVLADQEFNILDRFLRANYPALVEYLRKTKVRMNGTENGAYAWIQIHTTVEADHFNAAVAGANLALHYYAGTESQACVKSWILEGIKEFGKTQTEFMKSLLGPSAGPTVAGEITPGTQSIRAQVDPLRLGLFERTTSSTPFET